MDRQDVKFPDYVKCKDMGIVLREWKLIGCQFQHFVYKKDWILAVYHRKEHWQAYYSGFPYGPLKAFDPTREFMTTTVMLHDFPTEWEFLSDEFSG